MQYRAPPGRMQANMLAATTGKTSTGTIIGVTVAVVVVLGVIVLGIGLGVGLGVGLTRGDDSSSSSSSSLTAPTVTCTYNSSTCGCPFVTPTFTSRIAQGTTATSNSWPWIVALYISNNQTFCGGFLISYEYVVTAAHCVSGVAANSILVYAGLQKLSERSSAQSRTVANFTVHPDYSSSTLVNDIAVIRLSSAFNATTTVSLCCLTSDTSLPSTSEVGVVAGWGLTSSTASAISDDLMQGVIQVQSNSASCSVSDSSIRFCAGFGGTDACNGDSGSPFMTSVNNSWTCTGIVSAGGSCSSNSIYTRVSNYRSFISTNTGV